MKVINESIIPITKESIKEYLEKEWRLSNHTKYHYLFNKWFENLTENQVLYYAYYAFGEKSPFVSIV